jgi:hypothetical protein
MKSQVMWQYMECNEESDYVAVYEKLSQPNLKWKEY